MEKNLYEILEISKSANSSEIKRAYAKQLRKYPPEKCSKEFSVINSAYEILKNEEKRYEYDQLNGYEYTSQRLLEDGLRLLEEERISEGRKILSNFVKREGNIPVVLHEIAKTYALEGNYKKAYEIQKYVLEKERIISFEEMNCMMEYLYKIGDEESANFYMKKTIIKFRDVKTYYNITEAYINDKKLEKARKILMEKAFPFVLKNGNVEDYCELGRLLSRIREYEDVVIVVLELLEKEYLNSSEIEEKLEEIKLLIVEILNFKNAVYLEKIIDRQIKYINDMREKVKSSIYMDNIGWCSVSKELIGDMASISKLDFNKLLKNFLLVSVKKRIAVDVETRDYMDDKIIEYLEKIRDERDLKKIKENLILIERFHKNIYSLDAKYLFDKYGGFVPYAREVKNKKSGRTSSNKGGMAVFIILAIVIIVALVYFI
ncbi:MAG: DnaJ domain-containing protein [Clostridium sp.]|uniref:DnaJ domain-containing protein n=1 Tax=Clostridium sp. TaxID=1506 RepID=UPI003EE7F168